MAGNTKAWLMTNSRKEISFSGHTHSNYALTSHTHSQYALTNHTHSQYMTKEEVQEMINIGPAYYLTLTSSDFTENTDYNNNITGFSYSVNLQSVCKFIPNSVVLQKNNFICPVYIASDNLTSGQYNSSLTQDVAISQSSGLTTSNIIYSYTAVSMAGGPPNYIGSVIGAGLIIQWNTDHTFTVQITTYHHYQYETNMWLSGYANFSKLDSSVTMSFLILKS